MFTYVYITCINIPILTKYTKHIKTQTNKCKAVSKAIADARHDARYRVHMHVEHDISSRWRRWSM